MKVIFLENIEDNKVGDIKEVADGYARNYLFKRGIAKLATDEEVKGLEDKIAKLKKEEAAKVKESEEMAAKIAAMKIILTEEVNDEGHLYGAVAGKEIAEYLSGQGIEIEPAQIEIDETIKTLGEHKVLIKVGHGVEKEVTVKIARVE